MNWDTVLRTKATCAVAIGALLFGLAAAPSASAQSVEQFYKGKTVTVAIGSGSGGSHDLNAHILGRHIGKYLPGNPRVVVQNMPGAGSLTLANYLFEVAPKDGTYFGGLQRAAVFEELYTGKVQVRFEPTKMNWLGGPDTISSVAISWHTVPVKKAEDLLNRELIVGASGGTTETIPRLMNAIAGFKFKVIPGYKSGGDVDLAIERGEVEGRAATAWGGMKGRNSDWLEQKKVNLLFQTGFERHPELKDVPLALEFAKTPDDRKVAELFFAAEDIGYPYLAPPGVPADRLAAIRSAFEQVYKDPELIAEAKKGGLDINPVSWQRMTKVITDSYSAPDSVRQRLRTLVAP